MKREAKNERGGRGRGRKEMLADKPLDFENLRSLANAAPDWLGYLIARGFNRELRQEQKSSVKQLLTGGDLLAVLPTGFGKSLIFQLLALVNDDHVVLVICPLKSIVNDQIKAASSMGISAGSLSDCLQTDIVSGKYTVCFLLLLKKHSPKVSSRPSKEKATRFATISVSYTHLTLPTKLEV